MSILNSLKNVSLRIKLTGISFMSMVLLAGIIVYSFSMFLKNQEQQKDQTVLATKQKIFNSYLADQSVQYYSFLDTMANDDKLTRLLDKENFKELEILLSGVVIPYKEKIPTIRFVDLQGNTRSSYPKDEEELFLARQATPCFKKMIVNEKPDHCLLITQNRVVQFVYTPMYNGDGKWVGMLEISVTVQKLLEKLQTVLSESVYLTTSTGEILVKSDDLNAYKLNKDVTTCLVERYWVSNKHFDKQSIVINDLDNKISGFVVFVQDTTTEALTQKNYYRNLWIINIVALILSSLIMFYVLQSSVLNPLKRMINLLKELSQGKGDLTFRFKVESLDEFGIVAEFFNNFIGKLQSIIEKVKATSNTMASSSTELAVVSEQFNTVTYDLSTKSKLVAVDAEESSATTSELAKDIKKMASNISSVAIASEELSVTITSLADFAKKSNTISENAEKQTFFVTDSMKSLDESAKKINKVNETINKISSQTNLLALNASIEATRAGEAGKGFAVVANSIKELAKQTADATLDINKRIQGMQENVTQSMGNMNVIKGIISEIRHIISEIAISTEQQSVVTKDIAKNIANTSIGLNDFKSYVTGTAEVSKNIAKNITEMDGSVNDISDGGKQLKESSKELSKLAEQIKEMIGSFKVA